MATSCCEGHCTHSDTLADSISVPAAPAGLWGDSRELATGRVPSPDQIPVCRLSGQGCVMSPLLKLEVGSAPRKPHGL